MEYAPPGRVGAGVGTVVFVSLVTAVIASAATVYAIDRYRASQKPAGPIQVPSVDGLTAANATEVLKSYQLRLVVKGKAAHPEHAVDTVIEQSPLAGSQVVPGDAVAVVLSTGAPMSKVPRVIGTPLGDARKAIETAGLVVGEITEVEGKVAGQVTASRPEPGTEIKAGTKVDLTAVPEGKLVPDLAGMTSRKAREAIKAAGLVVGKVSVGYVDYKGPLVVLKQTPAAGQRVASGQKVDLVINEGDDDFE
jgi:serine/threonine-protein kinase